MVLVTLIASCEARGEQVETSGSSSTTPTAAG
jgi:hypothetical protein